MAALTDDALYRLAVGTFGQQLAPTMYGIAKAESGGRTDAHNPDGEDSVGLWQINRRAWPQFSAQELSTPEGNARAAVHVLQKQGLGAWTTFTGGHYKQYVPTGGGSMAPPQQTPDGDDEDALGPTGGPTGPITRNFPDGTFRALKPGATGDSPADWVVIGPAKPANATAYNAPEVEYDPSGRAYIWTRGATGNDERKFFPELNDETQAAGYQPPISPYQQASLGQGAYQFESTQGRLAEQQRAANEQQAAQLKAQVEKWNAEIAQAQKDYALQQANLQFLKDKEKFAQSQDNKRLANETRAQLFNQEATVAGLDLQMQNMVYQRDQANAQLQSSTAQFNASMGQRTQELNQQAESQRQDRLQSLNRDAATMAADPGDRGEYAAFALANSGWGQQASAQNDVDLRTDESLAPLQGTLEQRQANSTPVAPYSFTPIVAPALGSIDLSRIRLPGSLQQGAGQAGVDAITAANAARGLDAMGNPTAGTAESGYTGDQQKQWADSLIAGGVPEWARTGLGEPNVPKMEDGGLSDGAFIAGEAGEELIIPLAEGQALVLNKEQQAKMNPDTLKRLKKMAAGGIFSGGTVFNAGAAGPDRSLSRNFLADAVAKARSGTPFKTGQLPTSVFASSPGFDPLVTQLLASIRAQATGLPQSSFIRQAQLLAPRGTGEGVVRRSA